MAVMCIFAALLLGIIYKVRPFESMAKGAKKMLTPVFMVFLTYVIIYFTGNQMFYPTFAKILLGLTSKFSVVITSITMAIASFLHVDILYAANYAIPQMAEKASDATLLSLLGQSIYGVTMFIAPTSAVLAFGLSYLGVSYKDWVKKTWKLVLILLAITMVVLLVAKYI